MYNFASLREGEKRTASSEEIQLWPVESASALIVTHLLGASPMSEAVAVNISSIYFQ